MAIHLEVEVVRTGPTARFYRVGDLTFDPADRNLAYIDKQIASWLRFREWVEKNGQITIPQRNDVTPNHEG